MQTVNAVNERKGQGKSPRSVFLGRVFDSEGRCLSPSFADGRGGRRFRYYVAADAPPGDRSRKDTAVRRVSADLLERWVLVALRRITGRACIPTGALEAWVLRLELGEAQTQLVVSADAFVSRHRDLLLAEAQACPARGEWMVWEVSDRMAVRVVAPVRMQSRGGRSWLFGADAGPRPNRGLVAGLRRADEELRVSSASPMADVATLRGAVSPTTPHARQLCKLALLAPDLQLMILEGRQPAGLTLRKMLRSNPPLDWAEQRTWIRQLGSTG
ncbi:hypothetical protein [Phenylobacterium sp.]|uniref:hypothetical protein n=1 Tax=Phenylobacterium sp. TaxID=1871053 RepID=UPI00286E3311|nr:hypothetical protein [Phenylobacterium sp.]